MSICVIGDIKVKGFSCQMLGLYAPILSADLRMLASFYRDLAMCKHKRQVCFRKACLSIHTNMHTDVVFEKTCLEECPGWEGLSGPVCVW